ncbi:hypothetical protein UT300003_07630 [Clostridium sardiniense]
MGELVCESIPYKSFKEKIRLIKKYDRLGSITVYDDFVFINYKRSAYYE